jgi:hypothetical protein
MQIKREREREKVSIILLFIEKKIYSINIEIKL